jgi:hypothetical protein
MKRFVKEKGIVAAVCFEIAFARLRRHRVILRPGVVVVTSAVVILSIAVQITS